jgi:hypothetical protein
VRKGPHCATGLPDFDWSKLNQKGKSLPNYNKLYQTAIKYTKWR